MATKSKEYLYAVQRESGHEVVSATLEVAKVSDVEAQILDSGIVRLVHKGDVVATGSSIINDPDEKLTLHRWPAGKKLDTPVSSEVKRTDEA
jgi:hypothetical protein